MIPTPEFLKAKNDPGLRSVVVVDRYEYVDVWNEVDQKFDKVHQRVTCLRLHINYKIPYKEESSSISVDLPLDSIRYSDYTEPEHIDTQSKYFKLWFHDYVYPDLSSPWNTFLKKMTAKTEIRFEVLINANNEYLKKKDLCHHQLKGFINNDCYLLSVFVGEQNSASPVIW